MRRIAALACGLSCLLLPSSANATVTSTRNPTDLGAAIAAPAAAAAGTVSSFTANPPNGDPTATADAPLGGFPTNGAGFAVLSSGDALKADPLNPAGAQDDG